MQPSCSNCMFFESDDDTCRRYAPQRLSDVPIDVEPWGWPKVNLPDRRNWCGEWQDGSRANPNRGTE